MAAKKIQPTKESKCVECGKKFSSLEIDKDLFYFSKTKRSTTVFVHIKCWDDVPKCKGGDY